MTDFGYILDRIEKADFTEYPFKHLEITNFFNDADFEEIINCKAIALESLLSDEDLFKSLFSCGYKVINFPGATTNYKDYLRWHKTKSKKNDWNDPACEGFGVVLRLHELNWPILKDLDYFFSSEGFKTCLSDKFGISRAYNYDWGIQKYLDGYEISPHPDSRLKALTFMVNINPSLCSENNFHHTEYLRFSDEFSYVGDYWRGNPKSERCWVPWDWCKSIKAQNKNNSIVIFSPSNDTLHAVKANYDHLQYQRTQIYGNFWYDAAFPMDAAPDWENFIVRPYTKRKKNLFINRVKEYFPQINGLGNLKKDINIVYDRLKSKNK